MDNKSKGILFYVLISFGMAWILWATVWLAGLSPRNPLLFQLVALPGAFAPAVAALIVRKWVTREGFADAGLRLNLRRWPYYLLALFSPLIGVLVILALAIVLGVSQPDLSLRRALGVLLPELDLASSPPPPLVLLALSLTINAVLFTPVLWGEEFGWRGYLQIRLLSHRPLLAAVTTGLIWGIWHYPQVLMGYQYPDSPIPGLFVFPVSAILLSIIFGWLRLRTGSVWSASLAHAATNSVGVSLTMLLFIGGPNWILVSYVGVLGWVPLGALCAWIVLSGQLRAETA